jgi:uncharacterized protein
MKLDLTNYSVIDDHCHPFDPSREGQGFEQYWTLSMLTIQPDHMKNVLLYRMVMKEMRKYLELGQDASEQEVLNKRNAIYEADRKTYLDRLFRAAKIEGLVLDIGFPAEEFVGYSVDVDKFSTLLPINTARIIVRIEPLIYRFVREELSFEEFVTKFNTTLDNDIRRYKAVALKSVIAYSTGLEVKITDESEAKKAYDVYKVDKSNKAAEKKFRDFMLLQTLEANIRYDIPIQLHTGMGDSPILDLRLSNPLLLFDLVTHEHYGKAKYAMIHAGYPYTAEVGFLANSYPNVWVDLSEMNPFAGIGIEPKLLELMDMAPMSKIMYGSDAYNIPELFWFSAINFKKVFERVLGKLIEDDVVDENYAKNIASMILSENAKNFYRL